jgi:DNA-binding NarL/FixJ family response regulator
METIRVAVHASDAIMMAGISDYLRRRPEVSTVAMTNGTPPAGTDVIVFAIEHLGPDSLGLMRRWNALSPAPIVLVTGDLNDTDPLTIVECQVMAVLPRLNANGERLVSAIMAVAEGGVIMPPDLLGKLFKRIDRLQREVLSPHGLNPSGLTPREVDVLRLMSDGLDTNDIAEQLSYSERAVKKIIYALTTKLNLRNRAHAVAYALRAGII